MAEILKSRETHEDAQNENPWGEDYQKSIPTFDSEKANELAKAEKLDQECTQTIRSLLSKETFNPNQDFEKLAQYTQKRGERHDVKKPIHLYLHRELSKKVNDFSYQTIVDRYNPQTDEHYNGKGWGFLTRAYHSPENGTFIDFRATPRDKRAREKQETSLSGYEKMNEIISFAYTLEHELQHDVQRQRLSSGEISYNALRTARDHLVLDCLPHIKNGHEFYTSAHNGFFIEEEANDSADEFLSKVLPIGGALYESEFVDEKDPKKRLYKVGDILEHRAEEGRQRRDEKTTLTINETTLEIGQKTYSGKAEEIISDLCDDVLRVYPKLLARYPVLLLEYNPDGTRLSREDIENNIKLIDSGTTFSFNGKTANPKWLRTAYHKLLKHSKNLNSD